MVFYWNPASNWRNCKSPQITGSLLTLLVDLNNTVAWIVSSCSVISQSSSPCTNPVTIGITITFMLHSSFFSSPTRSRYLSLFLLSFSFTVVSRNGTYPFWLVVFYRNLGDSKSSQVSMTLLIILADLSSDLVWMVTILLIRSSSTIFS